MFLSSVSHSPIGSLCSLPSISPLHLRFNTTREVSSKEKKLPSKPAPIPVFPFIYLDHSTLGVDGDGKLSEGADGVQLLVVDGYSDPSPDGSYIIQFLDDLGPIKINLRPALYTTARDAISGSWCLQRHGTGNLARGVLRNSNTSRGIPTVPVPPT